MLTIDRLQPSDRDAWELLFRGYIDFYQRTLADDEYERAWQRLQADIEIHGRVARDDQRVVGIVHFLTHPHTNAADVCYLQDLFTDPRSRGRGVGRALIEHVADWGRERGCGQLYWRTQASNVAARALYDQVAENRGFIVYQRDL
ncbi:MAG TPA: GNAT family N-acetyltransferase [Solirubrobacteraceae bacterium]|nr:GNAT family N-acetyltransferase [Solirubrobacteraceae bacterium]